MAMIKVVAAEQEPVEIDGDNLYYRRLLMDGDLVEVADESEADKAKGAK